MVSFNFGFVYGINKGTDGNQHQTDGLYSAHLGNWKSVGKKGKNPFSLKYHQLLLQGLKAKLFWN